MRSYGIVKGRFWAWAKERELSPAARELALYCLTSPHTVGTGCFRLPIAYIAEDLGTVTDTVRHTVSELSQIGFLRHDEPSGWIWIVGFIEHNPIANINVGKSLMSYIDAIPRKLPFYNDFVAALSTQKDRFPNGYVDGLANGMANGSPNGMPTHDQEHDHEHDHDLGAPNGAGRDGLKPPATSDRAGLFGAGVDWLQAVTKKSNPQCRALVGKWRKDLGDDVGLIELLAEAQRQNVQGPEAWFTAAIKARKRLREQKEPPRTFAEAVSQRDNDPAWQGVVL